jgi:predicted nucleotidyltransferase
MLDINALIDLLIESIPDVCAVYLFGSHASGDDRHDSDVDIAILPSRDQARPLDPVKLFSIRESLAARCSRDVDLVDLRTAPVVLAKEIIGADRRVFCSDCNHADEFEMLTLSLYQKLNDERRKILDAGLAGEKFYGS